MTTTQTPVRSAILSTTGSLILRFHSIPLGEYPPPAPRVCFGRDELVEQVVGLAENLEPIALIGAGGVGKTSIALTVLHHNRIQERFGENRRFIRCDQFPASRDNFLARLSEVIGAEVKSPKDLTPLRPFLYSKEMFIILDNVGSVLDPRGMDAQEIYSVIDELCGFNTISICTTSRITTVPHRCKRLEIPTLSIEAARDTFYRVYGNEERSSIIDGLITRLDCHPLSITLLATVASKNGWNHDRLAKEWRTQRAQVLQTDHDKSLSVTIELSLASPTFLSLGPNARDLLEITACFPKGIDTADLDWLFPAVLNRKVIFEKFCVLSFTYKSDGFIKMLAPIQDHLCPRGLKSFPLLCATNDSHSSGSPSPELQSWNVSSDLPSITSVCIGQLAAIALVQHQSDYLIFDGEKLGSEEEWAPVSLNYEPSSSEKQGSIRIRIPTSRGSRVKPPLEEPFGAVEQKMASKLGPILGEGTIRLEAKVHKGLLNVSPNNPFFNFAR